MSKENTKSWLDEIAEAIKALGGIASLKQIQEYIKKTTRRELKESWEGIIGKTIGRNTSDSQDSQKPQKVDRDIFYSVEGLGKGIWGLRSKKPQSAPKASDSGNDTPKRVK